MSGLSCEASDELRRVGLGRGEGLQIAQNARAVDEKTVAQADAHCRFEVHGRSSFGHGSVCASVCGSDTVDGSVFCQFQ